MKRSDIISSLIIGETAALLMIAVAKNLALPSGPASLLKFLPVVFPVFTLFVMTAGTFLGHRASVFYQLSKFALVGGLNFLIDLGVLNLLIAATGTATGFWVIIFKAISFLIAVISSFLWNKFWTFGSLGTDAASRQFFGFLVVSTIGLLINDGSFATFNAFGPGSFDAKTWASISAALASGVGLIWNFIGYKFLVFKKESSI